MKLITCISSLMLAMSLTNSQAKVDVSRRLRKSRSSSADEDFSIVLSNGQCEICSKQNKNKPDSLTIEYMGTQGKDSDFQSSDFASCGAGAFPASTTLSMTNKNGENQRFDVEAGSVFTMQGSFNAETVFSFSGGGECYFHTSCSAPIVSGDQIGPFKILAGNDCNAGDTPEPVFTSTPGEQCEICSQDNKIKPNRLTLQYQSNGKNSQYQDSSRATCRGRAYPTSTSIQTMNKNAFEQKFDVTDGSVFEIIGPFHAETSFFFADGNECFIHTSCSVPLVAGDQIGPFIVLEGNECVYTTPSPSLSSSSSPSNIPTVAPSSSPTFQPSLPPSSSPTASPSSSPSLSPSLSPTASPSSAPTPSPSSSPSSSPTSSPSASPSESPSVAPSTSPTVVHSFVPTSSPSDFPSTSPSASPSESPSTSPTSSPSDVPSTSPTASPSESPSVAPSTSPTVVHSFLPTSSPSDAPSTLPTASPSVIPSVSPSESPSTLPTASPSAIPSVSPSESPSTSPTASPSANPSVSPSESPSTSPTVFPSANPSASPSKSPSISPSSGPTSTPSDSPSISPTRAPCVAVNKASYSCGENIEVSFNFNDTPEDPLIDDWVGIYPCDVNQYFHSEVWQWSCGDVPGNCAAAVGTGDLVFDSLPPYNSFNAVHQWPVTPFLKTDGSTNRCFKAVILRNDGPSVPPYVEICESEEFEIFETPDCAVRTDHYSNTSDP